LAPTPEQIWSKKSEKSLYCIVYITRLCHKLDLCGTRIQISGSGSSYPGLLGLGLHRPGAQWICSCFALQDALQKPGC